MKTPQLGAVVLVAVVIVFLRSIHADQGGIPAQLAALQDRVKTLEALVDTVATTVADLTALQGLEQCVAVVGDEVFFEGCNVHIRNGGGSTTTTNGLGNLIIGYNENHPDGSDRTGSHNVVIGPEHTYTSFGGLVAGKGNRIRNSHATVSGGRDNEASGSLTSVSGGFKNEARELFASVSGGSENVASGTAASVSGGFQNEASGIAASVSGGDNRVARGNSNWAAGSLIEPN